MSKQFMLTLLVFFFSEVALSESEQLSVKYCMSSDFSEYFLSSKNNIDILNKQPVGSVDDLHKTTEAALDSALPLVSIDQKETRAFEQLEMPFPSECRIMNFSTVGYGGIRLIFSRYTVKGLPASESDSVVIAKLPAQAKNGTYSIVCHVCRTFATYVVTLSLTAFLTHNEHSSKSVAFFATVYCLLNPNKCASIYGYLTDYGE